jgi:polysaccharide export outer membrane protein
VLEHRPIYILGEVNAPGEYDYDGALTLEQALAKAGGYSPRADRNFIILRREDWDTAQLLRLDGTALQIVPGDTITVRESFF